MFGLLAILCFLFKLLEVEIGDVDLVVLGLLFLAVHLTFGPIIAIPTYRRNP